MIVADAGFLEEGFHYDNAYKILEATPTLITTTPICSEKHLALPVNQSV